VGLRKEVVTPKGGAPVYKSRDASYLGMTTKRTRNPEGRRVSVEKKLFST